jgi:hypothetical protein
MLNHVIPRAARPVQRLGLQQLSVDQTRNNELHQLSVNPVWVASIRTDGIHPRGQDSDHLERYFSDSGAAMLLMETHSYLTRLARAVHARLTYEASAAAQ